MIFMIINVDYHIFSNLPRFANNYPKHARMLLYEYNFSDEVQITMFPWSSPIKFNRPQGYHFPFTYTEAQDSVLSHMFGLSAYRIDLQNKALSYEASLENVTNTHAVMYFNPSPHSAIVSINFVIILQLPCPSKITMKPICNINNIKFISLVLPIQAILWSSNILKYMWNSHLPINRIDI